MWATPPYLHNGSVPTIWDLLQKSSERPKQFHISGFVYNSDKLGFVEDKSLPYGFDFIVDCPKCKGNSNKGHEYGADLSDIDKSSLIEFLKSYDDDTTF